MIRRLCKDCKHNDENEFCNDCGYFYRETTASGSRNKSVTQKTTNANRIRAMTDEELAGFLQEPHCNRISDDDCKHKYLVDCTACWLDWLKKEADT